MVAAEVCKMLGYGTLTREQKFWLVGKAGEGKITLELIRSSPSGPGLDAGRWRREGRYNFSVGEWTGCGS